MTPQFDFSRPLNSKERTAITARRDRLLGQFGHSANNAKAALNDLRNERGRFGGLSIRNTFVFLEMPLDDNCVSDRKAPPRSMRPSATRISTSKGVALRLYLTLLAVGQAGSKPGQRVQLPTMPIAAFHTEQGWSDLVATEAVASGKGATAMSIRDKKARSLRAALNTLSEAGLVELPGAAGKRGRHDGFALLHEAGTQPRSAEVTGVP